MSFGLGEIALDEACRKGASYADVRIGELLDERLTVKKGILEQATLRQTSGFGVRVVVDGAWGFAGSVDEGVQQRG